LASPPTSKCLLEESKGRRQRVHVDLSVLVSIPQFNTLLDLEDRLGVLLQGERLALNFSLEIEFTEEEILVVGEEAVG